MKHVGALGFIINLSPPLRLVLRDELSDILGDELVLVSFLSDEAAPASDITGRHDEFLPKLPLDHDVPAGVVGRVPLQPPVQTAGAEVGVALSLGLGAGAGVCGALALTLTPREPGTDKFRISGTTRESKAFCTLIGINKTKGSAIKTECYHFSF